jgi:zona occludens toxin (predicted ATPase)
VVDKMSKHSEKHYSSYQTTYDKHPIFRHIKSNNSGTAKMKMVKNERDPPGISLLSMLKYGISLLSMLTYGIPTTFGRFDSNVTH